MKNTSHTDWGKRVLSLVLLFATLLSLFSIDAFADGWDGSGSAGDSNTEPATGSFSISWAGDPVYGYRFSIYDGNGDKLGHSIDIMCRKENTNLRRSYKDDKQSHIDIYRDYLAYGTASLGTLKTTHDDPSVYMYFDDTLSRTPTEVESWLTGEKAAWVATQCDVDSWGTATNYIVCEPIFSACLAGYHHAMTMAEYAVYQSSQYGWTAATLPKAGYENKYSWILRQLSASFGRHLYAELDYDVFETEPVPDYAFKIDSKDTPSILIGSSKRYNAAEDVLKYQMGMAVYTDRIPAYTLTIDPNGGSYKGNSSTTSISIIENAKMEVSDPIRQGYSFIGWSISNSNCSLSGKTYTQGEGDCTLTANWTPNRGIPYTVNHYKMNTSGSYPSTPTETESFTGTTGASVTPSVKSYTGFTSPAPQTVTIKADGSTVVNYYYSRNKYTVTLNKSTGISSVSGTGTYYYGASVTIDADVKPDYTWNNWTGTHSTATQRYTFSMPAYNVTDTANATSDSANYTVKHWLQDLDLDGYTLEDTDICAGTTGDSVTPSVNSYEGFTAPDTQTVTIKADGSTVVNYYYTRQSYTVTVNKGTGISSVSGAGTYLFGASVTIDATVSTGYDWSRWSGDYSTTTKKYTFSMPAENVTVKANASAGETEYTVKHWLEDLDQNGYTLKATQTLSGAAGEQVTPAVMSYTGFTAPDTQTVTIAADGSTVVNYYYERNSYTVTLRRGTGIRSVSGSGTYLYGESVTINATVSSGYSWCKWTGGISTTTKQYTFTMPARNVTATANATPNVYTITLDKQSGSGGTSKLYEKYGVKFYINTSTQTAVDSVTVPTRVGYTFGGYYRNTGGRGRQIINSDGDILVSSSYFTGNTTIYANWIPNPDTPYTVNHYRMDLNGNYPSSPYSTEHLTGTTDATLVLSQLANSYTGFSYSHGKVDGVTVTKTTIAPDGSRIIDLYYTRNRYTVTLNKGQGISSVSGSGTYYYGATVTIDATVASQYTWYRWTGTHNTYTQRYTFRMPAYDVTDTANAEPVLKLEPITPNASYRENTEVISAFQVVNPSVIPYTGAEDVTVTFTVKNSTTGEVIHTSTKDTVIIPDKEEGLLYVKWRVPASVSGNSVTVTATIRKGSTFWDAATFTNTVCDFLTGTTPDTDYEDGKPSGWGHKVQALNEPGTVSWEEWGYENGSFRKVSYSVTASITPVITPGTGETHWLENGQWHMRSGYGICAQVQANISANGVPVDAYTQVQYVQAVFPEFSYSQSARLMAVLSKFAGGWQFALTEYGNYHFTPVWFPDGRYAVTFAASDLWTPAGMIHATKSSAPIIIDGNMYDDWYVGKP